MCQKRFWIFAARFHFITYTEILFSETNDQEMREVIDVDDDGELTKDEFIKHASECEFVCDMLQVGIGNFDEEDY